MLRLFQLCSEKIVSSFWKAVRRELTIKFYLHHRRASWEQLADWDFCTPEPEPSSPRRRRLISPIPEERSRMTGGFEDASLPADAAATPGRASSSRAPWPPSNADEFSAARWITYSESYTIRGDINLVEEKNRRLFHQPSAIVLELPIQQPNHFEWWSERKAVEKRKILSSISVEKNDKCLTWRARWGCWRAESPCSLPPEARCPSTRDAWGICSLSRDFEKLPLLDLQWAP